MSIICSSCCAHCQAGGSQPTSSSIKDPYDLDNLLKAGALSLQSARESQPDIYCEHRHASDGWHPFLGAAPFLPFTSLNDVDLCKQLEFLSKHRFLAATYHVGEGGRLTFRIYLMHYDLAGAKGALRVKPDSVMAPARKYLRAVLARIDKSLEVWKGGESVEAEPFIPDTKDPRTLAEIYSDLASPKVIPVPGFGDISNRLLDYEDNLEGLGLRSKLYRYQRRSVAAMLHRELDQQDVPDPLFIPVTTVDNKEYFFQPGTMEVLLERPMVAPCRGGILCEELGTGKTVMIISLILATLRQLPKPEESLIDDRPVMTPLSFRHFPSLDCMTARARFSYKGKERERRVPSLVELLLERSRISPDENVPDLRTMEGRKRESKLETIEDSFESLPLATLRKAMVPFYFHYLGEPTNHDRDRRQRSATAPKKMYLSSATLVVVPPNLMGQWDREIVKHAEHPLRVLILRDRSDMPSLESLASDYDIVLMTYARFTRESKGNTSKLHSMKICKCPELPGTSIPDCNCQVADVSPLLQIRWKRLVIDEGHVSASLSTHLTPCTKALSIERRWIVTGTPTTNLLGLALGQRTVEETAEEYPIAEEEIGHDTYLGDLSRSSLPPATVSMESPASSAPSSLRGSPSISADRPTKARIWDHDDRGDLRKLGNMITHFIAVPQFAADGKLVSTHVTDPLLDPKGPRPGSIQILNQVMQMVMIRHRIEDIEDDVILPLLNHESILLDLDPFAIKSYNALQASIAVNAIDSERRDKDYLFHPANSDLLQVTVKNMSQIMFWSTDEQLYNAEQLHKDAATHMNRAIERQRPPEDIALLKDALRHIANAVNDTVWRYIHQHEDVPYRVYHIPEKVYDAWTRIPGNSDPANPTFAGFLSADRLLKLYDMVLEKPLITADGMIKWGRQVSHTDAELRQIYLDSQRKKSKRKSGSGGTAQFQSEVPAAHSQIVSSSLKKSSAKETMDEVKAELKDLMATLAAREEQDDEEGGHDVRDESSAGSSKAAKQSSSQGSGSRPKPSAKMSVLAHNSMLAKVRMGASASNKLNYIINEVLKYSKTEKFLIFTDSELTLAHIAEALELIHVKHLRFSAQIPPRNREQLVLTFETSETYRVFLMELKHGARGLNLVSASRVIFCEPVWQADVESQAIKRAHRIGQTKPITVKTLAIRGTAEENMVARRHALQNSHDKLPKLIEEAGMRHFISNPKFIETPPTLVNIDIPLLDLPPVDLSHSVPLKLKRVRETPSPKKRVLLMDPVSGQEKDTSSLQVESPPKRQRTIRFADQIPMDVDDTEPPQGPLPEPSPKHQRGIRFLDPVPMSGQNPEPPAHLNPSPSKRPRTIRFVN
ncbi:hypothetical protein H1R20_g9068, partial [Candolleomyces eurysporus]